MSVHIAVLFTILLEREIGKLFPTKLFTSLHLIFP